MARRASGSEHVAAAHALLRRAKTADQLRLAQAVLLPLELGLSLEQTARAIGRSTGTTCGLRTHFAALSAGPIEAVRGKHELRNHAHADLAVEARILDDVLARRSARRASVVAQIKPAIEARLGKVIALSSVYRMLARHGWHRSATRARLGSGTAAAPGEWKKTPGAPKKALSAAANASVDVGGSPRTRAPD